MKKINDKEVYEFAINLFNNEIKPNSMKLYEKTQKPSYPYSDKLIQKYFYPLLSNGTRNES